MPHRSSNDDVNPARVNDEPINAPSRVRESDRSVKPLELFGARVMVEVLVDREARHKIRTSDHHTWGLE